MVAETICNRRSFPTPFPGYGSSILASPDTRCRLFDEFVPLYHEAPEDLHRKSGKLVTPFIEGNVMCVHVPDSLVLLLARLGGRGRYSIVVSVAPSQVYLRLGVYFGYISSRIDLPRYSRFGPPQRSPLLKTISILGLLSAVKRLPDIPLGEGCTKSLLSACEPLCGETADWCWFTSAPSLAQMRAYRVFTPVSQ